MKRLLSVSLSALLLMLAAVPVIDARADDAVGVKLDRQDIAIGTFYNGTTLEVSGSVPEGCKAVVRVLGVPQEVHMKQKGKAFGLLWMNINPVSFSDVPSLCLVMATDSADALGLAALKNRIGVESDSVDHAWAAAELIKVKIGEGLYQQHDQAVAVLPSKDGRTPFSAQVALPSRLSPGEYTVEVFAVKNGAVVGQTSTTLTATLEGAPALMASLAFNHGALYGVLATLIAILGGWIIGRIFQGSKDGAH